ncbi:isocitrate lyase/PEP mutase family protein [Caulobacter sp. KR2-114]|uniref:isocitrate lyase/PEP mutase family protein n=1 Tax=Caulobacter sp. KR2-114 TaxID=3400912 RepID=UPI003BFFD325
MVDEAQQDRARRFRAQHDAGCFVLPNAWDIPSALMAMDAGYPAIGTTSAGVAFAMGLMDGEKIGRERMLAVAGSIARRLPIPVTADLEAGYGPSPADVAETVRLAIAAGVVGCNIEDSDPATRELIAADAQAERIAAGVAAARQAGLDDFVLNARTDAYFLGRHPPDAAFEESVRRGRLYLDAGARSVFVPGPGDAATGKALADALPGPLNLMAGGFGPTASAAELFRAGVRRISLGGSLMAAAYDHARTVLAEIKACGEFAYTARSGPAFLRLAGLVHTHPEA